MSSENPSQLYVDDKFIFGPKPKDGEIFKGDVTLKADDGTTLTVKQTGDTVYREDKKMFESTKGTKIAYIIEFPKDTKSNSTNTSFTTPKNGIWTFSDSSNISTDNKGNLSKRVTTGTVNIIPSTGISKQTETAKVATTFVDNATKTESSSWTESKTGNLNENPLLTIGLIVYDLLMDMMIVVIFWILFVSISCWLMVPAEHLYPTDVSKFPFVYYKTEGRYYDMLTHDTENEDICKKKDTKLNSEEVAKQKSLFNIIDSLKDVVKEMLSIIYPAIVSHEEKDVNILSVYLTQSCVKDYNSIGIAESLQYLLMTLVFQNFLYCNKVTQNIHSIFSYISVKILPYLGKTLPVVLFAAILYVLFMGSGEMSNKVIDILKIKLKEGDDLETHLTNSLIRLLIYSISCTLTLVMPLCSILILVSWMVTTFTLGKNIFGAFNKSLFWFSLATLLFSLGSYSTIILLASNTVNPKDMFNFNEGGTFAIMTMIFSAFGILLPVLSGLFYGLYLAFKLLTSFFQFLRFNTVLEKLQSTIVSLILVALVLLIKHVKSRLGDTYMIITIIISVLIGGYNMSNLFKDPGPPKVIVPGPFKVV